MRTHRMLTAPTIPVVSRAIAELAAVFLQRTSILKSEVGIDVWAWSS